jgi:N-acyl-D-aspartate/D-glutamate deacylase
MTPAERLEEYLKPDFRAEFVHQTDQDDWNTRYWPLLRVSYSPSDTTVEGQRLVDLAAGQHRTPAEVMLDLVIDSKLAARFIIENPQDEEYLLQMYQHDAFRMGASDAGAHQGQIADYRYPTYFLAKFVRSGRFPLERAIKLMTTMATECYGITDRGALAPGFAADVNVIDPATVQDGPLQRVNDLPGRSRRLFSDAAGIDYTFVNGQLIRDEGRMLTDTAPTPGRMLRSFASHTERFGR